MDTLKTNASLLAEMRTKMLHLSAIAGRKPRVAARDRRARTLRRTRIVHDWRIDEGGGIGRVAAEGHAADGLRTTSEGPTKPPGSVAHAVPGGSVRAPGRPV